MNVLMTGGSGFVGTHLTKALIDQGHNVTILARRPERSPHASANVDYLAADTTRPGSWQEVVRKHDVLVNLAGVTIFKRWNDQYKKLLRESRILTTTNLVDAIAEGPESPTVLLSTSAVGYYGFRGDEKLTENAEPGDDFLARLAVDWEAEALKARDKGVRVVISRFGVVFGPEGGALQEMSLPFKLFVGGPIGSGKQWFSWIHVEDLCRAALFCIDNHEVEGPHNFTAPEPVRNKELTRIIGKTLNRPSFMPAPGFMIKLVMGEFGEVILNGQRVIPAALQEKGFSFNFPVVQRAVEDCLG